MNLKETCLELFGEVRSSTEEENKLYAEMIDKMSTELPINIYIKCPLCGESHYQYLYSTSTCLHWTPVYKDGVLVNENPNKTTNHYHCLNCNRSFIYED